MIIFFSNQPHDCLFPRAWDVRGSSTLPQIRITTRTTDVRNVALQLGPVHSYLTLTVPVPYCLVGLISHPGTVRVALYGSYGRFGHAKVINTD